MSGLITKLAPVAAVLALVSWCCWSYLGEMGSGMEVPQEEKLLRITRVMLSPAIKPPSDRNPFRPLCANKPKPTAGEEVTALDVEHLVEQLSLAKASLLKTLVRKIPVPKVSPPDGPPPKTLAKDNPAQQVPAKQVAAKAAPATQAPSSEETADKTPRSLALSATYVQGDRRLALIDGRIYKQGDRLKISGATSEPFIVTEISAQKVLIQQGGRTVELRYQGLTSVAKADKTDEQVND